MASRRRHLGRGATSLDAALTGAGASVATPPLAALGRDLARAGLGPSRHFQDDLRRRLVTAASVAVEPAAEPRPTVVRAEARTVRWLAVRLSAGVAAAGVMVAGVGVASARALPGDALYGIKRDTEGVQLDLAHGDSARGLLHLQFASSRLAEVHSLLARAGVSASTHRSAGTAPAVVPRRLAATLRSTLSAMDVETSTGASELTQSYLQKGQPAALTKLEAFTRRQESALTSVLPSLPAPAAATSLGVLHKVAAQTSALLATPAAPATAATQVAPSTSPSPGDAPTIPAPTASPTPLKPVSDTPSPEASATTSTAPASEPASPDPGSPAASTAPSDLPSPSPSPSVSDSSRAESSATAAASPTPETASASPAQSP